MNKRALIRRLDRHMNDEWKLLETWVTFDVPASIPRWSPGPEWIEADCADYWLRPSPDGQHEVMVLTYDRRLYTEDWVLSEPPLALVSATVAEEPWYALFADKPHRIYNTGDVCEPLRIEGIDDDHPAVSYYRERDEMRCRVAAWLHEAQPPGSYHTMWFGSEVQIKPDGSGWYITLNPSLGLYKGEFAKDYWADVHDLAYMVQRFARVFQARKTYVERREQPHFTDTLWHDAMKAVGGP
jgi:hypothetical protein